MEFHSPLSEQIYIITVTTMMLRFLAAMTPTGYLPRITRFSASVASFFFLTMGVEVAAQIDRPIDMSGGTWRQISLVFQDTVTIVPQEAYDRGGLHRTIYGNLWRDLWATPIEVPVLDLNRTGGGLTVTKIGGGKQTTSLRFMGEDGREYKFRSVDKDPSSVLPKTLQETFVDHAMQDLISSQNPAAALLAIPLLDAVDIIHAHAFLSVLPDDPRLGEYREEFAGMFGTIEEHPQEGADETPGFYGYSKIKGSDKLYEDLREDNDVHVHYIEYLKARLVDMLMGDWDRHMDQYRWAIYEVGGEKIYRPIPRDRDMAFSRYDGIIPWWAEQIFPEIEGVDDTYSDIEDLTWAGKTVDRRFLVPITRQEWDSTTAWVISRITDNVIDQAVGNMPVPFQKKVGEEIRDILRSRRDLLPEASEELFDLMQKEVELWGSEKDEFVAVDRLDDQHVQVSFYRRDKNGEKIGIPYLQHTFDRDYTEEIRIMLLDGDDMAVVSGTVNSSIVIRIDGGGGADTLIDDSKVKGYFFLTPIPDAETSTYFYDHGNKTAFGLGDGTRIDRREYEDWDNDTAAWRPPVRDYGSDWMYGPWGSFSSDEGISAGLWTSHFMYGFRQDPFAHKLTILGSYAFGTQAFKLAFDGEFRNWVPNAAILLNLWASELEILHFHGFGNETAYVDERDAAGYYDVRQREFVLQTGIRVPRQGVFGLFFGLEGSYTRTQLDESPLLSEIDSSARIFGSEPTALAAITTGLQIDSRDNTRVPSKGIYVDARARFFPDVLDARGVFSSIRVEGRTYLSWDIIRPMTLALRGVTEQVNGTEYPFYEAAYLGGKRSLRGFSSERFAGDIATYGNVELRMHLFNFRLLTRNKFGLVGFSDAGRVWLDGERSDEWHYDYGGGFSLSFVKPGNLLIFTVARSDEADMRYTVNFGHLF